MFSEFGNVPLTVQAASSRGINYHEEFINDFVQMNRNPLMSWIDHVPIHQWGTEVDHWCTAFDITEEQFHEEFDSDDEMNENTRMCFPMDL